MIDLKKGDCLDLLPELPDDSIDLILTDPPYGTTACKWDSPIPLAPLWKELKRVAKPRAAIVLFGSEPFSSHLRTSNLKMFKYDWIWDKKIPSGMCNAKIMPMRQVEIISVFMKGKNFYYPQMTKRKKPITSGGNKDSISGGTKGIKGVYKKTYDNKYPTTLISFDKIRKGAFHPTQKPVPLMEYMIKTYTNPGDLVLDFTMGSGTTGVACVNLNRSFIGFELDEDYFEIARNRISSALLEKIKSKYGDFE